MQRSYSYAKIAHPDSYREVERRSLEDFAVLYILKKDAKIAHPDSYREVERRSLEDLTVLYILKKDAKIAQLVERHLAKVEVAGSNPVFRS